jgi:hypothetical protein
MVEVVVDLLPQPLTSSALEIRHRFLWSEKDEELGDTNSASAPRWEEAMTWSWFETSKK